MIENKSDNFRDLFENDITFFIFGLLIQKFEYSNESLI